MHVVATAGHVDHGKSTLVQALTGSDPDRLAEEHRRGLSIELGYCWTTLASVGEVAFVDVPGHERFLSTMLAGVGPVPAVLFVVAADDPWMPQTAEHLAALNALGVSHGVVAITRSDLADPAAVRERTTAELSTTTLRDAPIVAVSGRTGQGLDELRSRLAAMVASLPTPDEVADVRLWVDRRFTIKGAGTVVTGTLPVGRICVDDTLTVGSQQVRVRALQSLERPVDCAYGVSRVALNLAGDLTGVERGSALVSPDAWQLTDLLDARVITGPAEARRAAAPPAGPILHIGAAAVPVRARALGGDVVRLRLSRELPLRIGDRAVLRDPGSRRMWGVTVLDPAPPELTRRGAAAERAAEFAAVNAAADVDTEVERRGLVPVSLLQRIGVDLSAGLGDTVQAGDWLLSRARATEAGQEIRRLVDEHDRRFPLDPGVTVQSLAERLGLPSPELVIKVVPMPLQVVDGRVVAARTATLPPTVERALDAVAEDLAKEPFAAPTADRLRELALDSRAIAAAAKAGRLLRLADGIVLLPEADLLAGKALSELPQPFTTSEARVRLGTSRRVALPLLEHLDRQGVTRRLPDDRRSVIGAVSSTVEGTPRD